jgi:carbonic anhydrase
MQAASLGAAASLLVATRSEARAAATTDALLLTCMDYRVMDDAEHYMAGRGMRNKYDHIVLAGSSLGAITDKYPAWKQTFWDHLDIAIKLHDIKTVMLLDHRDCGAYKLILGAAKVADAKIEKETHAVQLKELKSQIGKKHPKLAVEMLLMGLDGKVDVIAG